MPKRDPADPDPKTFRRAMRELADAPRPDVAVRAAATPAEVGPEDEVRSDPEAPKERTLPKRRGRVEGAR